MCIRDSYYTEENLQLFRCIKELKEQGMFLKDLKELIPDMLRLKEKKAELTVAKPEVKMCIRDSLWVK